MSLRNGRRIRSGSSQRRFLRAAVALGAATTMFCGVCATSAGAAVSSGPDVEAIKQTKLNYWANVDLNNWPALYQLFTPGAVVDTSDGGGPVFQGRDQFVAFDALALTLISTHHEGYNPVITVSDDGLTATGVWQMNDRLTDPFNTVGIRGHGVYTDAYVKNADGAWVIDKSVLTYHSQYIEILPGLLNIRIPLRDDGTPFPVSSPEAGADPNPDVEAIKQLKHSYWANVDLNNWPALYQLFTPGAVIDTSDGGGPVFQGRDQFVAFDALALSLISTHHEGYNPVITVSGDGTTATGVWQLNDRLADPFNIVGIRGHGVYTDAYVKNADGSWLIDNSVLTYHQQYIEILPGILNIRIPLRDDGTPFPAPAVNVSLAEPAQLESTAPAAPSAARQGAPVGDVDVSGTPAERQAGVVTTVESGAVSSSAAGVSSAGSDGSNPPSVAVGAKRGDLGSEVQPWSSNQAQATNNSGAAPVLNSNTSPVKDGLHPTLTDDGTKFTPGTDGSASPGVNGSGTPTATTTNGVHTSTQTANTTNGDDASDKSSGNAAKSDAGAA